MHKVLIIAEAGVNHNGDMNIARQLIDVAADSGVDIVKFQTFKASNLVTAAAKKADYQVSNTNNEDGQLQMLQQLELSEAQHDELMSYCSNKGIQFLSTAFDPESIDLLKRKALTIGKIPSGEITNLPYLRKMAKTFPQIILSTGMSDLQEVQDAVQVLRENGVSDNSITVLHCNTEYPTPMQDVHLNAMVSMGNELALAYGYSDHTNGIEVAIAAVALGATIIEKHFTIDRSLPGPDHKASLEPEELKAMVSAIRNIEIALGGAEKKLSASEAANKIVARKSIIAACAINAGALFTEENLTVKRPGNGISPMRWDDVIGTVAKRNFETDELIEL